MTNKEIIKIPEIVLNWSDWYNWNEFKLDSRSGKGVKVPNKVPGVYEAKLDGDTEYLTIGKSSDLRFRIKQGLVKGKIPHSAGEKIRQKEITTKIFVRWAKTDRPSAVEEELHRQYRRKFGRLPKYVDHT